MPERCFVHGSYLLPIHKEGDIPLSRFEQYFHHGHALGQAAPRILNEPSVRWSRQAYCGCTLIIDPCKLHSDASGGKLFIYFRLWF
jgi:hypothetical protein